MTDKDIKDYCKNCDVEPPAMRFKCPECEHNPDKEIFAKDINVPHKKQIILDACCGSRMFHFDKENKNVVFMDNRDFEDVLCDGRQLKVHPDIIADFRDIPFEDNTFSLVIFDPPHLLKVGKNSWLCKKYGKLSENWPSDIKKGFNECMRVLKPNGTLIFKWATRDITLKQILEVIGTRPIIFHKNNNTFFLVFMKGIIDG